MKSKVLLIALSLFFALSGFSQYNQKNLKISAAPTADYESAESIAQAPRGVTYQNLRLFPIRANQEFLQAHVNVSNYVTLKDALTDKKAIISEQGGAPDSDLATIPLVSPIPVEDEMNEPVPNLDENWLFTDEEVESDENGDMPPRPLETRPQLEQVQHRNSPRDANISQIQSTGANVNALYIENVSNDTIFIMAGEVVKGGKQDRVIAQATFIPPNSGKVDLSVFCVEKNRWQVKEGGNSNFDGYFALSQNSLRKVVTESQNQSAVWSKVDEINTDNNTKTSTNTYTAAGNSEEIQAKIKEYIAKFESLPQDMPNIIGVIAATGDKVIGCDMFATPALFAKEYPSLLQSYSMEAITKGNEVGISFGEIEKYFNRIVEDEERQEEVVDKNGTVTKDAGKTIHISTYE